MPAPVLVGIVNITEDSFSDGGRFLDHAAATAQAHRLIADGADVIELGAAASNISSATVTASQEIARLAPVIDALAAKNIPLSVDTCQGETQRFAILRGIDYLNDITGFPDAGLYPALATAPCRLVVMHMVERGARAQRVDLDAETVWRGVDGFFAERLSQLENAGIARERLILDPGMGFFLSSRAEASVSVLAGIGRLKSRFGLPVMISVSRKSFLGALTGRTKPGELNGATLAAELYAAAQGVDMIRTHDPGALRDALLVTQALAQAGDYSAATR